MIEVLLTNVIISSSQIVFRVRKELIDSCLSLFWFHHLLFVVVMKHSIVLRMLCPSEEAVGCHEVGLHEAASSQADEFQYVHFYFFGCEYSHKVPLEQMMGDHMAPLIWNARHEPSHRLSLVDSAHFFDEVVCHLIEVSKSKRKIKLSLVQSHLNSHVSKSLSCLVELLFFSCVLVSCIDRFGSWPEILFE